jgi:hypothetical protein
MKIGAEDKKKLYAMLGLLAVAVLLLVRFFTSLTPGTTVAASIPNPASGQANAANRGKATEPPLDPTLRIDLLRNSEGAEYKGSGRNIFEEYEAPLPQPKQQVVVLPPKPPPPPPPALPPPIPLKFYGFANKPGQPRSVFLANGDDIFIGREGDIVNRRYKIVRIQPTQVEIEDVLNNNRQTIPLTPS